MTVRYHSDHGQLVPEYVCQRDGIENGTPPCTRIGNGGRVDTAVGHLLLATVTPLALEVSLAVQAELDTRAVEADMLRRQHVERSRHHADQARRRYLAVDPDNRLVAANLEADWNDALRALTAAQEEYERRSSATTGLADNDRARIAALATDFPALWNDPRTPQRERKRMVRLLIEDITLTRDDHVNVHVRFKTGNTETLHVPFVDPAIDRRTPPEVIAEIDQLLDQHTEAGVAVELNRRGVLSGTDRTFNVIMVNHIRRKHGLASRYERLRRQGMLTLDEIAASLDIHPATVKKRAARGQIPSAVYNKDQRLYALPGPTPTVGCAHCGTPIPERVAQGQKQKYCSVTCRTGEYASRKQAAGWKRRGTRLVNTNSTTTSDQTQPGGAV